MVKDNKRLMLKNKITLWMVDKKEKLELLIINKKIKITTLNNHKESNSTIKFSTN